MAKLESYSNLTKLQEDMWKKNFCFGQELALSLYAKADELSFKSTFTQKTRSRNSCAGWAYFQYKAGQFLFKHQAGSSSLQKTTTEFVPDKLKDLKLKAELENNINEKVDKKTISAEYTHQKHKTKLAIVNFNDLKFSTVFGANGLGCGLDLTYDLGKTRLAGYNAAFWYFKDALRGVLKHVSTNKEALSRGDLVASVHYTRDCGLQVGSALTVKAAGGYGAQVALQKNFDGRILKARVNEAGELAFAVRTKINPSITVVTAIKSEVFDMGGSFGFGIRLKLNQ